MKAVATLPLLCTLLLLGRVLLIDGAKQVDSHTIAEGAQAIAAPSSQADKLAAAQRLTQQLVEAGGEVNVEVREAGEDAGLATYASHDLKMGDTILLLPTDQAFRAVARHGAMDFLLDMVLDYHTPDSPRRHMWDTSPRPHEVQHLLNFPQQYLPLLQHADLEELMGSGMHSDMRRFHQMHAQVLEAANITYEDMVHAMGLIGTRFYARPHPEDPELTLHYGLPMLELANHYNDCPHFMDYLPCSFDEGRECMLFRAGASVAAGTEVCGWYGHLLPDRAFLEYGFLLNREAPKATKQAAKPRPRAASTGKDGTSVAADAQNNSTANATATAAEAPKRKRAKAQRKGARAAAANEAQAPAVPLFGIDRHDYDTNSPLVRLEAPPASFIGNLTAVTSRIEQLQQLLAHLRQGDARAAEVAAQGPAPGDVGGRFLQDVLTWRQQRQAGVAGEVARLQRLVSNYRIKKALTWRRR